MDSEQLTDTDLEQVIDYLQRHRALSEVEFQKLKETSSCTTRAKNLLELMEVSSPSTRGLFINSLRYTGNLSLANKYDIEQPILSTDSFFDPSRRRKGQITLTVEVSAIKVSSAEYGISLAGLGRRPSLLSLSSRDCWISVNDLNKSATGSMVLTSPVSLPDVSISLKKQKRTNRLLCFCCCFHRSKNKLSLASTRPVSDLDKVARQPGLENIEEDENSMHESVESRTPNRYCQRNRRSSLKSSQKQSTPCALQADGIKEGQLAKKAQILAEKSSQFYELIFALLTAGCEKLVCFLEQESGLLFLDSHADSYSGIQLHLVATTLAVLNQFISKVESGAVEKKLNQIFITDQHLKTLRVRKLMIQCVLRHEEAQEELAVQTRLSSTNNKSQMSTMLHCEDTSDQSLPVSY